jgi:Protein of unknown function (DUF4231)
VSTDPTRDQLTQDFGRLIDQAELEDAQKHFLRARWLDQVNYMDAKAAQARARYHAFRLATIVSGVTVPTLVGLSPACGDAAQGVVRWMTIVISLIVAITAGVEELFHYGERWRHFRETAEWLRIEGWRFFLRTGSYRRYRSEAAAYPAFADRVEEILQRDIGQYFGKVLPDQEEQPGSTQA